MNSVPTLTQAAEAAASTGAIMVLPPEWNYSRVRRPVYWWTKYENGQLKGESVVAYFSKEKAELNAPDGSHVNIHCQPVDIIPPTEMISCAFSFLYWKKIKSLARTYCPGKHKVLI